MRALLLETPELDACGQMALDEALLDRGSPGGPILRFYRWFGTPWAAGPAAPRVPLAATFGYFQGYGDAAARARERGLPLTFPLVRRPTGGGLVYHDGDLTFSIVFPWDRLIPAPRVYQDIHGAILLGLKVRRWAARWSDTRRGGKPAGVCFAEPVAMDLIHDDGRKFLGGALRRRRGVGLYQGSLRPEGFGAARMELEAAMIEGLGLRWKALFARERAGEGLLREAERLRASRYKTDAWNKKR